jgi:hypothetical protein
MRRLLRHASQLLPALLALGLAAFVLRSADISRVWELVRSLGWRLPLLLLPYVVFTLLEAVAWRLSFSRFSTRPPLPSLLGVRIAVEAVMLGLPSGAVISESLQPYLLKRRCGVPFETAVVAGVGRKFFVILSHGLVLALSTLLAWPLLDRTSDATIGRRGLPWVLLGASTVLLGVAVALAAVGVRGRIADRLRRGLDHIGGRWLGSWLEHNALRFQRADAQLAAFFQRDRLGLVPAVLLYVLAWFTRALETLLFLRLVGVAVPVGTAMVVETTLILVRSMAVPVPAGLGVQDLGYVLSLKVLGVPDATTVGTAFVVLKRGKDIFWILFGFALLILGRRRGEPVLAGVPERSRPS